MAGPQPSPGRQLTLEAIGVGWPIYSTERRYLETDLPVGGTVVEVVHDQDIDPDTGEVQDRTRYRVLCTWRPSNPWQLIQPAEVDTGQLYGIDRNACATGVRWCARQISQKRRGLLTSDELDALRAAWALARAGL